jgi:hypothetical protein
MQAPLDLKVLVVLAVNRELPVPRARPVPKAIKAISVLKAHAARAVKRAPRLT